MSNHTFTPGTRVWVFPAGQTGTVAEAPEAADVIPGFVPVVFDGTSKAQPCSADNLAALAPADDIRTYSDADLEAEAKRRCLPVPASLSAPEAAVSPPIELVMRRLNAAANNSPLSFAAISRRAGIPATTLRNKLGGRSVMGMLDYFKICRALDLNATQTLSTETEAAK
ncbi:hypothetical protein [Paeniglutamicibacter cryotolerans]|uniref:Uncharacterized protein n=1 Tax=Paeniglutamicibacter cryotolerans TaxID=670079 RepID=A0A839QMC4_9MICC|nr:hypothetical protein [Paeniglutamicibacter cryotolerans]MBB2995904.1 hypothetical protein [Paeniglutamicibacter cryotolerans]